MSTDKKFVLLDVGSHRGQSIQHFKQCTAYKKHSWTIYGFEPHKQLHEIASKAHPGITIFNKAAWVHDNGIHFYEGAKKLGESHTVMNNKTTGDINYNTPNTVTSIDLSRWIKDTFSPSDFIILKMDIEGAEYDVLEKMITDNSISYISVLFIEWHAHKLRGFNMNRHTQLVQQLAKLTRPIFVLHEKQLKRGENWFTCLNKPDKLSLIK